MPFCRSYSCYCYYSFLPICALIFFFFKLFSSLLFQNCSFSADSLPLKEVTALDLEVVDEALQSFIGQQCNFIFFVQIKVVWSSKLTMHTIKKQQIISVIELHFLPTEFNWVIKCEVKMANKRHGFNFPLCMCQYLVETRGTRSRQRKCGTRGMFVWDRSIFEPLLSCEIRLMFHFLFPPMKR